MSILTVTGLNKLADFFPTTFAAFLAYFFSLFFTCFDFFSDIKRVQYRTKDTYLIMLGGCNLRSNLKSVSVVLISTQSDSTLSFIIERQCIMSLKHEHVIDICVPLIINIFFQSIIEPFWVTDEQFC